MLSIFKCLQLDTFCLELRRNALQIDWEQVSCGLSLQMYPNIICPSEDKAECHLREDSRVK